jgi:hypothetical protein
MSLDSYQRFITSTTQPPSANTGDEWFNPTTNRLYQYLNVSGQGLQWVENPTSAGSGTPLTLGNLTVSGGTGSFSGSANTLALTLNNAGETVGISATPLVGFFSYEVSKQSIIYATANATNNVIVNFIGSSSTPLNNVLSIGQSVTVTLLLTNGATAYYLNGIRIDGVAVTPKWQGGTAPAAGNATSVDAYSFSIIKTANNTFTVIASLTKFA